MEEMMKAVKELEIQATKVLSLKNTNAKISHTSLMIKVSVNLSLISFFLRV